MGTCSWLPAQLIPLELAGSSHQHRARAGTGTEPGGWGVWGTVPEPRVPAGLESPTHALRADADPWASSAATTLVTLAEPHCYDRDLEIILYPCGEWGWCPEEVWGR